MKRWVLPLLLAGAAPWVPAQTSSSSGGGTVYRCPGPPVLYTDAITAKEAQEKGCRTIEGAPITIVNTAKPRPVAGGSGSAPAASAPPRSPEARVDPQTQRARDTDARKILEAELQREEQRLAEMKKEFNDGQPERLGSERNYAKYEERVADMKAAIARKEADIAAIKRELGKLPPS